MMDGRAWTNKELAADAGVTPQTASVHLHHLARPCVLRHRDHHLLGRGVRKPRRRTVLGRVRDVGLDDAVGPQIVGAGEPELLPADLRIELHPARRVSYE